MTSLFHRIAAECRRLRADRRANVLMIFAFALIPMTFATGMTIDYARAARVQTRLNAVTDAAALAGVTPDMLSRQRSESVLAVYQSFYAQAGVTQCQGGIVNRVIFNGCAWSGTDDSAHGRYTLSDGTLSVVVQDTTTVGLSRTVTATYTAASQNIFGTLLGSTMIAIGGTTTTNAKTAPNIDFYVLLDTSSSMAIPATSAGISLLQSKTGGCAFACHTSNGDRAYDANNTLTDYYGVATSYGIKLRIDEAKRAVPGMMSLAQSTSATNNAAYQAALMTFAAADARASNSFKILQPLTTNLNTVGTAAGNVSTSLYYINGCPTASYCNNDADTASSDAFNRVNAIMPNPGNGTNVPGDRPQEILFIVTDGMRDEGIGHSQVEVAFDNDLCTKVKNRGIRVAILYTEYLASSMNGSPFSQNATSDHFSELEPALTSCASPGLLYKVTTDEDISAALSKLFLAAISNAHITN